MKLKTKYIVLLTGVIFLFTYQGCGLEDFNTLPVNIPVSVPIFLVDDGTQSTIISEAVFCLDSNEIYNDYRSQIQSMTLVEVAFRFSDVIPAEVMGDMQFILRKSDVTGVILVDHLITGLSPALYKIPGSPYILDLPPDELEQMNAYLGNNGTCFYGYVGVSNLSPSGRPKVLKGYVDMLFKAVTKF